MKTITVTTHPEEGTQ